MGETLELTGLQGFAEESRSALVTGAEPGLVLGRVANREGARDSPKHRVRHRPTLRVMTDVLDIQTDGRLRVLRLDRPERKNALNGELIGAIVAAVRDAGQDDDVWAIAVTGNGDTFCSGLDLQGLAPERDEGQAGGSGDDETERDDGSADHFAMVMRVECEKPVLAGVNGVAVGIGVSLAMCADIRIAAPSARFLPGYARVGTSPDGGLTWTLTEAVGYERAMRFFLEQRTVSAPEALALGMVGEVTETDEEFEQRFLDYGQVLAGVARSQPVRPSGSWVAWRGRRSWERT